MSKKLLEARLVNISMNLSGDTRHEKMAGRDYLVAPMVMIVEGVLNGSDGPLFYPEEEISKFPGVWNHKPVIVYHPMINGVGASACDPDLLTNHQVGVIMNTKCEDGKLKAEAWLEEERMSVVDDRVADAIEDNAMMELSTGLFVELEQTEGEFNGTKYKAIARNFRPDHLALLPDKTGACSIADGAGFLRLNEKPGESMAKVTALFREFLQAAGIKTNELSYRDIEDQLRAAVTDVVPDDEYIYVVDVFDSTFIFERDSKLYRMDYSLDSEKVKVTGTPVEVVRRYEYVVANNQKRIKTVHYEELGMNKEAIVNELIKKGTWDEEDREFLMAQNEDQLKHLVDRRVKNDGANGNSDDGKAGDTSKAKAKANDADADADADADGQEKSKVNEEQPVTAEEYINNAPDAIQEVLNNGLQQHNALKAQLVKTILENDANILTSEQLATKNMADLKSLAVLCGNKEKPNLSDFSGQGSVSESSVEEPLEQLQINWNE